jgi:hypothetical protein
MLVHCILLSKLKVSRVVLIGLSAPRSYDTYGGSGIIERTRQIRCDSMFSFLSALGGGPKLTDTFGLQDGDLLILFLG